MRKVGSGQLFFVNALWLCLMVSSLAYCGGDKGGPPGDKKSPTSDAGFSAFQEHTYPYLRNSCMPCHATRAPRVASSDPREAYQSAKGRVDFKDVPQSSLVKSTQDGHCGRKCRADVAPLIETIKRWAEKETVSGT